MCVTVDDLVFRTGDLVRDRSGAGGGLWRVEGAFRTSGLLFLTCVSGEAPGAVAYVEPSDCELVTRGE